MKIKRSPRAFLVYRVLTRLNEQAHMAWRYGRDQDARDIARLIGRIEYQIFGQAGFEFALRDLGREPRAAA